MLASGQRLVSTPHLISDAFPRMRRPLRAPADRAEMGGCNYGSSAVKNLSPVQQQQQCNVPDN